MKKPLIYISALIMFTSCKKRNTTPPVPPADYIPVDSANKMVNSYLTSLSSSADTNIRSWSIDVDQLRLLIDSTAGTNPVKHLKIMLGHNLNYINSGKGGISAGFSKNALTIIVAGYDGLGNYIFVGNDGVLNRARPCPSNCPPGNAGYDLIIK